MRYREYGRTITKIIEEVCKYPDGEKKNEAAKAIVYAMSLVTGISVKDDVAYHKLWDHLMILSDFALEQAWPFSQEELETLKARASSEKTKPDKIPYKNSQIHRRHYGLYLESMMKKLKDVPDGEEYKALSALVTQQAKRSYIVWNGDLSDDNIIVDQVAKESGDSRISENLKDRNIYVNPNSLPIEPVNGKKKKKKK